MASTSPISAQPSPPTPSPAMDATAEVVATSKAKDVQRSSLCSCIVNFFFQEGYLITAFELLHQLVEDGCHDQAIRLCDFFSDPSLFPPDLISLFNSLRGSCPSCLLIADPQTLLEEKIAAEEKLAISEYELRLAQEDLTKLQSKLQKMVESPVVIESEELSSENRADLVNSLKNKLQSLVGQHTDVLESLTPTVRKRVEVLREIQEKLNMIFRVMLHQQEYLEVFEMPKVCKVCSMGD